MSSEIHPADARSSHRRLAISALALAVLAITACGNGVQVRTLVGPDANFSGRRTFHLMRAPTRRGNAKLANDDPMLVNSITYRRVHAAIRSALEKRGYEYADSGASMEVAYYATAERKLNIQNWDYGYGWRRFPRQRTVVNEYEQGTVIVDVVDPGSRELLWRGQGKAVVSTDPEEYATQLEKAVDAIIAKFPAPTG